MIPKYKNGREAKVKDWVLARAGGGEIVFGQVRAVEGDLRDGCITLGLGQFGIQTIEAALCYHAEDAWHAAELLFLEPKYDWIHADRKKALDALTNQLIELQSGESTIGKDPIDKKLEHSLALSTNPCDKEPTEQ
jgi:hypothetical protein